jgi:hypothetical protein
LGLGDATAAAQYVITHPQTSHNPTNFDFLLDRSQKANFYPYNAHKEDADEKT